MLHYQPTLYIIREVTKSSIEVRAPSLFDEVASPTEGKMTSYPTESFENVN